MKKLKPLLLWTTVFLLLLVVLDQAMVRIAFQAPVLSQGRDFYLEFRKRIIHRPQPSREAGERPSRLKGSSSSVPRYVYVDKKGDIQFANSLEEVPKRFRKEARSLER
jgi:hypothetical protein